jgi:hypothetical protein
VNNGTLVFFPISPATVLICLPLVWVDCGLEPWFKAIKLVYADFSTKHTALRSKRKDRLAGNHDNVSECSNMSTCGLLF